MTFRVGIGFDTHPLQPGLPLWLGGVFVPSEKGAVGHSDADAFIHALCDALLGAAGLGDIGIHFPDTDARWRGVDSKELLKATARMLAVQGWTVENVDGVICLEKPKIASHIPAMKQALAHAMGAPRNAISIKATTNEKMGYVGREEGVNAYAVALIKRDF